MKKLIILLFIISISFAQQKWTRTYGGADYDFGYSVRQTSDGGYIIAGYTYSFGAGATDVYLIKSDSLGDTLWTKTYGGMNLDEGYSVQQTLDGGYIIVGYTNSFGAGIYDFYLIKTDSTGDTLWTRTYGGTNEYFGYSVQQTSDGGYIIVGYIDFVWDVYLIKTNASGDTLWTRIYDGTNEYFGYSVQQTSDGGYIIAGGIYYIGPGVDDVYLIKTDSTGDTLWTRTYGGTGNDCGLSVQQTLDGGYIIVGYTNSFGAGNYDFYLIKTDSTGDTLWTRTYGGTNEDEGYSVQQTSDGGYIVVGYTASFGTSSADVYLIKTDSIGDTLWTRTYGGTSDDEGYSVQQTSDGGYIIAGVTWSYGAGYADVYLIKTDENGNAVVEEMKGGTKSIEVRLKVVPNPFTSFTRIPGYEKEDFILADITGRLVGKYKGAKIGENLPSGVYFIISQNKNIIPLRIVKIR
jgi:hypothetical protein